MNPVSNTAMVGSVTGTVATIIMWATTWPIHAPTEAQALAMAAMLVPVAHSLFAWVSKRFGTPAVTVPEAPVPAATPVNPSNIAAGH